MKKDIYIILLTLFFFNCVIAQTEIKNDSNLKKENVQNETSIYLTGIVNDSLNKPFQGVNVIIKNTRIGTVVDENGKYKIDITDFYRDKKKIVVSYSFVGYKQIEIEINFSQSKKPENQTINITLKEEAEAIICNG